MSAHLRGAERVAPMEAALAVLTTVELALRGRRPEDLRRAIIFLELAGRETNATARAADLSMALAGLDEAIRELVARRGTLEADQGAPVTFGPRVRNGPIELSRFVVALGLARSLVTRAAAPPSRPRAEGRPRGARKTDRPVRAAKAPRGRTKRPRGA